MNNDEAHVPVSRGRRKGSINRRTLFARDWVNKLGCTDPIEFMLKVLDGDTFEVTKSDANGKAIFGPDGSPVRELTVVPLALRIECAKTITGYLYPRLNSQHVQAEVSTPGSVRFPTEEVLRNPALVGPLSELAILIAMQPDEDDRDPDPVAPCFRSS